MTDMDCKNQLHQADDLPAGNGDKMSNTTIEHLAEYGVSALAGMAECSANGTAARDFLTSILSDFVDQYAWHRDGDSLESFLTDYAGELHEIADGAVPVYNHDLFAVMVETQAWAEDVSEYGTPNDLMQATQWAVYMVANRLVHALAAAVSA